MMVFLGLIGAPIAYLIVLVNLLVQKDRKGIGVSLLFAALAVGTAYWSIIQSRSSTAGIGILGLPLMLALGGLLGLAFGRWRASTHGFRSVGALLSLGGAVLLIAFNIREGWKTIGKNEIQDEKQAAHSAEIERDRALIAALENDSVSPSILDTLALDPDLGIALQAVRNGSTNSATLARVYRTSSYPDYFFQALAGNPRTPPEIIRELYTKPRTISGLDYWFAQNPATPRDILDRIATTTKEPTVISALLQNPVLDCALLEQAARKVAATPPNPAYQNEARIEELRPTVCIKAGPKKNSIKPRRR